MTLKEGVPGGSREMFMSGKNPEFEYSDSTNLVLIGPRGAGKTEVGKLTARTLGKEFIDTDEELVRRTGKTIPELIAIGDDYFRQEESRVSRDILSGRDLNRVIATGGGIVERFLTNFRAIVRGGVVIYLRTQPQTSAERIGDDPNRPTLTGASNRLDDMKTLYVRRDPLYEAVSDFLVDTDNLSVRQVTTRIVRTLEAHRSVPKNQGLSA
jgi:shikimate kinase